MVSVILPTRNRGHLIERSLLGVLNQTYTDFEVLVVDDASTDDTEIIVKSLKDERIRYIREEKNIGAAAARNLGIKLAIGKLIAFQDSSDEWSPLKLAKQVTAFSETHEKVCVVYTGSWRKDHGIRVYIPSLTVKNRQGDIHKALLWGNFVDTPSLLVRRECFDKAGMFDERLPRFQDWELCLRISKYYHFRLIDEPLFIAYCQEDSISFNSHAALQALKIIFEKYHNEIRDNLPLLAHYYHWLGVCSLENKQKAAGRDYLRKALMTYPSNTKYYVSYLLSFLGTSIYNRIMSEYQKFKK